MPTSQMPLLTRPAVKIKPGFYSVLSLFAGCGGLDLGFRGGFKYLGKPYPKKKFQVIWANDINPNACVTYQKNLGDEILCGDIWEILESKQLPDRADVVLGGFPCQDFSHAGKRLGFKSKRGRLYQSMIEVVRRTRPYVFVAENVKGLLTMPGALETIKSDFSDAGYHVNHQLYLAANYEVPQARERVIIVGTRKDKLPLFEHPSAMLSKDKWITLSRAIGDLENKPEGKAPNHFWSRAKMFKGQGNTYVSPDKISPTMRAEHHGNIEWHWNKKRRLSAREAARIQTFPDDFVFYPSTSGAYRQLGNAVPPVLGWHVSSAIQKFLDTNLNEKVK